MPKASTTEDVFLKPLPSTKVPWLVMLVLLAAIVLFFLGFLRRPGELLGPPLKPNEWVHYMQEKPKPPVVYHLTPAAGTTPATATTPAPPASPTAAPVAND